MRKTENRSNNWNDAWYVQLRIQACYVLRNTGDKSVDVDDLINVAWCKCARYIDKDTEILKYTGRIRCFMYDYICKDCKSIGHSLPSEDLVVDNKSYFDYLDIKETLQNKLNTIPKQFRSVLTMRFIHGLTYKEIGVLIGLTHQGAHLRVQKALDLIGADKCEL